MSDYLEPPDDDDIWDTDDDFDYDDLEDDEDDEDEEEIKLTWDLNEFSCSMLFDCDVPRRTAKAGDKVSTLIFRDLNHFKILTERTPETFSWRNYDAILRKYCKNDKYFKSLDPNFEEPNDKQERFTTRVSLDFRSRDKRLIYKKKYKETNKGFRIGNSVYNKYGFFMYDTDWY